MSNEWAGTAVRTARTYIARRLPLMCQDGCGKYVQPGQNFVVAHIVPRWERPELTMVPSNWGAAHKACSDASGQRHVIEKARAEGARVSGTPTARAAAATSSISLSVEADSEVVATDWHEVTRTLPWLGDLREIPDDAVAPRYMTSAHPLAVGSYGAEFVQWCAENPSVNPRRSDGLRWWQIVVAYRVLEHDVDGVLVWRNVLITMARQLGKSWLVRALILWRIQQAERFGEEQCCIHMAHRMSTATEVWRPAARWATGVGWHVRFANGEQLIESPDGGRWLVRAATDGVGVGFALSLLVCDEGWMIPRAVVEAADPALSESTSPQLMLISTAGDSSSDLFGTYRDAALLQLEAPTNTLIVEWSAPRSLPIEDRETWRLASPHWSTKRENEILDKISKTEALEFKQNYLNHWVDQAHGRAKEPGVPVFSEDEWTSLNGFVPSTAAVAAVESWFGQGLAVCLAEPLENGRAVGVSVQLVESTELAAAVLLSLEPPPSVMLVGKSLANDPELADLAVEPIGSTSKQAVTELRRLVDEGALMHDSSPGLTQQVLALRTVPGADGPRVASKMRLDAVKAVTWAASRARAVIAPPRIF